MVEELKSVTEGGKFSRKRKMGYNKKGGKGKKKQMGVPYSEKRVKVDKRMKKLYEKRARDYNSDNDDEEDDDNDVDYAERAPVRRDNKHTSYGNKEDDFEGELSDDEGGEDGDDNNEVSEDEDGEIQPGITRFMDGCKAFRLAFKKLLKSASDDVLGPVLSAHKHLVAEKLAEEEGGRKVKGDAKKEKLLIGEKGHVKPANFLDSHEKFLIGIATKGVVKLFNAVNKAQHAQKGLNPSRAKDEKAIKKRRREAFFSELGRTPSQTAVAMSKGGASSSSKDEGPSWAPLRDNYMLTNPKLKDWDKNQDTVADDVRMAADSDSSDEE